MLSVYEGPERAAALFNEIFPGHAYGVNDMVLVDIYFTGWPEGAVPVRGWIPKKGVSCKVAVSLSHRVAEQAISEVIPVEAHIRRRFASRTV